MAEAQRFEQLMELYLQNGSSRQEYNELMRLVKKGDYDEKLLLFIQNSLVKDDEQKQLDILRANDLLDRILSSEDHTAKLIPIKKKTNWWKWVAASACIVLLISVAAYFVFFNKKEGVTKEIVQTGDIKAPETNKAVIQLSDGHVMSLDTLTTYSQGAVSVTKTADGNIEYRSLADARDDKPVFNTLSNPRGSKVIDMQLADGSHIWLNAGSSITYPVAFAGNERRVSMTGEGYFEITHNSSKPFTITKGGMNVRVLGTKFNVNAYDEEGNIKVTLLEGSVEVKNKNSKVKIAPGQQAQITHYIHVESRVDLNAVMAWKNGLFNFNRADIKGVMRQIARWYDAEVVYVGAVPTKQFGGDIQRDLPLSSVLKNLERYGVQFKVEGKTIKVSQ